jgi:hypothetical protein
MVTIAASDSSLFGGSSDVAGLIASGVLPGQYSASIQIAPNGVPTLLSAGDVHVQR